MFNGSEISIKINGTGIQSQSISFKQNGNVIAIDSIGNLVPQVYSHDGAPIYDVSFSYIPIIEADPVYGCLQDIKNNIDNNYVVEAAGVSGTFKLQSYSISFTPNNSVAATANYRGFYPISGEFAASTLSNQESDRNKYLNGFSLAVESAGGATQLPIYNFSYQAEANYTPLYGFNSKYPIQISLLGGEESFNFTTDSFKNLDFSGKFAKEVLNYPTNLIKAFSLDGQNYLDFNFSGAKVRDSEFNVQVNSYLFSNFSFFKRF